jgi:dihydroorotase
MGLAGIPVAAETIALHTIFSLVKSTGAHVHLCRLSSAEGVELVRQAKAQGLPVTCDVSINSLHLSDVDMGYFDSRARLLPPLRQQRDRDALRAALADGTIDALVSDHHPVGKDAKVLPFAEAAPGATGVELLLGLALHWARAQKLPLPKALQVVTSGPARILQNSAGTGNLAPQSGSLGVGAPADLCVFDPDAQWEVQDAHLRSQGKFTPFIGHVLTGRVKHTVVAGRVVFDDTDKNL